MAEPDSVPAATAHMSMALRAADIVGIWDGDMATRLVYGDENFARIYGVDPAAVAAGVPFGTYITHIHPEDVDTVRAAMNRLYEGAQDYSNEHRILRPDGALRWVLTRGRLVRDADGNAVRFAGVSVDITDRKAAEERQAFLLELADRMRSQSDTRGIVGQAVTMLGRFLGVHRVGFGQVQDDGDRIALETGYANGLPPLHGIFPMRRFGARAVAEHHAGVTTVIEDVEQYRRIERDAYIGVPVGALVAVPLIREGRCRATLFVSVREPRAWTQQDVALIESVAARMWDAIERARAEDQLRRLNASLESEVESRTRERERNWRVAPVLMLVADFEGRLLQVNPAWSRVLGWTPAQTLGRTVSEFLGPEDQAAGAARLLKGTGREDHQLSFVTASGEQRRIAWTTVTEGGHVYGYGRDVTEQLLAEDRLRQAQKMEAVGQLTGGLAHDFNNLLTAITGSLELLRSRLGPQAEASVERFIDAAQGAARRAAALTLRLLAFSRRQTLDPRPTDVNALIGGMIDLVRRTVGPPHEIEVRAAAELWTTLVDPHQLENALLNLSINARDAMPGGGRITIATSNCRLGGLAEADVELPAGEYIALIVTDTGTGMSPEVLSRAFDPFFTTKPLGSGTGLGLSMIYGFARQSGGEVKIDSRLGEGTTVTLYLPRHAGPAEMAESVLPVPAAMPRSGAARTVLIVDDEPTVRMLAAEVLGDIGYAALEAETGAAGLAVLEGDAGVDLLVTDVGLPGGMTGRQLAAAARRLRPGLPVLFITGFAESAGALDAAFDPSIQVLVKPFSLEALAQRIEALVAAPPVPRDAPPG